MKMLIKVGIIAISAVFISYNQTSQNSDLLTEINSARFKLGLSALQLDECLTKEAQNHCDKMFMTKRLSHDGFQERINNCGKGKASENVAQGQRTPKRCVRSWLNSPGHYKNMMGKWKVCGVGKTNNYWCAIFSK